MTGTRFAFDLAVDRSKKEFKAQSPHHSQFRGTIYTDSVSFTIMNARQHTISGGPKRNGTPKMMLLTWKTFLRNGHVAWTTDVFGLILAAEI
jgi:hypothetical protein